MWMKHIFNNVSKNNIKNILLSSSLPLDLKALFKDYHVLSIQGSKGWGTGQGLIWFDKAVDFFSLLEDSQK